MAKSTTMPAYNVNLTGNRKWYASRVNSYCEKRLRGLYPDCDTKLIQLDRAKHGNPTWMTKALVRGHILLPFANQAVEEGLAMWDRGYLHWLEWNNTTAKALAGWSKDKIAKAKVGVFLNAARV
jgi:hypothetical protein